MAEDKENASELGSSDDRRGFMKASTSTAMAGGLLASYGTFAVMAGRFLYSGAQTHTGWQLVATLDELPLGESRTYITPSGAKVVVARQQAGDTADSFVALSSVCPHLGCQVHWEPQHDRFFCPCHQGVFDPQGKAIAGPPGKAGQSLARFPLKVESGLLYIEVAFDSVYSHDTT